MEIYACIHLQHYCNFMFPSPKDSRRGGGGGGLGDYSKQLIAAEKCTVESEKLIDRLEKKY